MSDFGGPGQAGHGDYQEDMAMIAPLVEAVTMLTQRVEELERLVIDELFGGIEKLHKDNTRKMGIDGLRGKYGSMFEPHMETLKSINPDQDVFEIIYDLLDGVGEDQHDEMVGGFEKKLKTLRGIPDVEKSVEVEISTETEPEQKEAEAEKPAEADPLDKIRRMAKNFKD